jgi:glycerol-3-phosphate O-acyltransferase 3/4
MPTEGVHRQVSQLPGLRTPPHVSHQVESLLSSKEKVDDEIEDAYAQAEATRLRDQQGSVLEEVLNISSVLTDGASAMVDDSFLKCFTSATPEPWNWNFYLFPAWVVGCAFR